MGRVRILIVYNSALDARSVSGVQTYFAGVVEHWIAGGHTVDFLVGRSAWPVFQSLYPKSRLVSSDDLFDPNRYLGQTWRYLPIFAWRMLTARVTRLPEAYDVVLACAQFIYEVGPARTLARRCGAALAVKIHHVLSTQRQPAGLFDRLHFLSERTTARWLNREADAILCGTELIARDFNDVETALGLRPSRTHATGYGIDLERLPLAVDHPKEFDAVLLGRVHEHKGVFDAVPLWQEVVRRRPGARLLVIGEGPHRAELQARIAAAGLGASVHCSGPVSEAEKVSLVARSRVGLSLSREEGWGLSVNEFLAAGLPVVAMEVPVFRSVFPGQLDLVPQKDLAATTTRILHWLDHPDEARRRGLEGRRFVERYDHRRVAAEEMRILTEARAAREARVMGLPKGSDR
jgi:glycosyltransferase involved in cell wall biosynthesis